MSIATWYRALTEPQSIAIIGASNDGLKASGRVLRYLLKYNYTGDIYPVNPRRDVVQNVRAYSAIEEIGKPIDLAVISTPADRAVAALESCVALNIPMVLVVTSGFAEFSAEGAELQDRLLETVRGTGTRVLGPNSVGLVNTSASLAATINTGMEQDRFDLRDGGMALVTQSGAVGSFMLNTLQGKRVGLGLMVSTGNEMDVTFPEMLEQLIADPKVTGIGGYIEGIEDGPAFIRAIKYAQQVGKPLGFLKVGRTAEGAQAIASHTGALAGADDVYTEIFRRYGVARLDSFEALADWLQMIEGGRSAQGPRLSIATTSGGMGVMVADYAPEGGLEMATFEGEWRDKLEKALPTYVTADNPIDMAGAGGEPEVLRSVLSLMNEHPGTDVAMIVLGNLEEAEDELVEVIREINEVMTKPLVVVWLGGSGRPVAELAAMGIPAYTDPRRAMHAMKGSILRQVSQEQNITGPPHIDQSRRGKAMAILKEAQQNGLAVLDESSSKSLLRLYGIPVVEESVALDPVEAASVAERMGFPVVVKLLADDLAHKSDIGGVLLDLGSAEEVQSRSKAMLERIPADIRASARLLVQRMVAPGLEMLLGLKSDPTFGPVIAVGMGGTLTEILDDVALGTLPLTENDVKEMLSRLRMSELMGAVRGGAPRDVEAVISAVSGLALLAQELGDEVAELDINPLIVANEGEGACVVDAVIVLPQVQPTVSLEEKAQVGI